MDRVGIVTGIPTDADQGLTVRACSGLPSRLFTVRRLSNPVASLYSIPEMQRAARSWQNHMPRYYFDLANSEIVSDERGQELPDDMTAMDMAELVAQ